MSYISDEMKIDIINNKQEDVTGYFHESYFAQCYDFCTHSKKWIWKIDGYEYTDLDHIKRVVTNKAHKTGKLYAIQCRRTTTIVQNVTIGEWNPKKYIKRTERTQPE